MITENKQELTLNSTAISYLKEIAKWSYFLSIAGFVGIGLMLIMSLFVGSIFAQLPNATTMPFSPSIFGVIYFLGGAFYFFPILYLFKFSSKMKIAIRENNNELLEDSFKNLKSHYKFIGITTIVILSIYALIAIGGIAGGVIGALL